MRAFTIAERRIRLARRQFLGNDEGPSAVTGTTTALISPHATDPVATPYLSRWARSAGFVTAELEMCPGSSDKPGFSRLFGHRHDHWRHTDLILRAGHGLSLIDGCPAISDRYRGAITLPG